MVRAAPARIGATLVLATVVAAAAAQVSAQVSAQDCPDAPGRAAFALSGLALTEADRVALDLPPGWQLTLEPAPQGWDLRLYDGPGPQRIDLSQTTPPHTGPNPRDLYGWHFRDAANSGPNLGDVNAPQHRRDFFFAPGLAGTGGYKPSDGQPLAPDPEAGRGTVWLRDIALSPPGDGNQARMLGVTLDICLTWPRDVPVRPIVAAELEGFAGCGLDLGRWSLVATLAPPVLSGDFDGDGAGDEAVLVTDAAGRMALATCRAGTWLDLLTDADGLWPAELLPRLERWQTVRSQGDLPAYDGAPPFPDSPGDVIALERFEKSLHLLAWSPHGWRGQEVYRVVTQEP